MNIEQNLEDRLKKQSVAPRITLEDVNANIVDEAYFVIFDVLTICVLKLQNGFTVTGESACASPENFNKEIGEEISKRNAVAKIWGLMGYELRSKLKLVEDALIKPQEDMVAYVGTKVVNAKPMNRLEYCHFRGWQVPADENPLDEGYLIEYTDREENMIEGFKGYVSWSPKDVFERAYTAGGVSKPETFLDRLQREYDDLTQKTGKLSSFIGSEAFFKVPYEQRVLLIAQKKAMTEYETVLENRLQKLHADM
ncbi:hypothetical protein [Rhizobium phage RHph_X3_15]|nr:hypothetical protein [Rhizobium phage RHph_X3_15]